MHKQHIEKHLKYSAEIISNIIIDVESYSDFLPWVERVQILDKTNDSFVAELDVNFKGFNESYKSLVKHYKSGESYYVEVEAISGPFKTLINKWQVEEVKDGCLVNFFIDFEFKSRILDMVVGMVFSIATEKMIHAFEQRAEEICKNSKDSCVLK